LSIISQSILERGIFLSLPLTTELWAFVRQLTEGAFAVSPKARQSECGSKTSNLHSLPRCIGVSE